MVGGHAVPVSGAPAEPMQTDSCDGLICLRGRHGNVERCHDNGARVCHTRIYPSSPGCPSCVTEGCFEVWANVLDVHCGLPPDLRRVTLPSLLNAVESAVAERVWVHRTICATNTAAVAMPASPRTTSLHLRRVFVSGAFRPESGMKSLSFE